MDFECGALPLGHRYRRFRLFLWGFPCQGLVQKSAQICRGQMTRQNRRVYLERRNMQVKTPHVKQSNLRQEPSGRCDAKVAEVIWMRADHSLRSLGVLILQKCGSFCLEGTRCGVGLKGTKKTHHFEGSHTPGQMDFHRGKIIGCLFAG